MLATEKSQSAMSATPLKLVAISFIKRPLHSEFLQHFQELYIYGVLSQLARFTELHYKDLATLADKIQIAQELSDTEILQKLHQICQSTRTQHLFTGAVMLSGDGQEEVYVNFQLYDSRQNQYIVNETETLRLIGSQVSDATMPNIAPDDLNRLINRTVARFLQALPGKGQHITPESLAPLSPSLKAMQLILRAHQITSVLEKIKLYETAIREDAHLETAYYHLARIFKGEAQYEKSVLYYRETLKVSHADDRNKAIYATEAGICCALLGRQDLALQWWLRGVEYDSTYINPYFNIANTYEDQENYAQAEEFFVKAQVLAPDDFRTFFNLARIYSKMGIWEKALNQYQYQLKTEDQDPWCHSDVATCYLNLGDLQNAKRHLEKTVALDPEGEAGQYAQLILGGLV